ncbi:MAG: cell wall hydrolase [Parvularculaceae bacterium]
MKSRYEHSIQHVNWTLRSLIAATGVSVCVLATALSATASARRAEQAAQIEQAVASQAELAAQFAEFMKAETVAAREALLSPRQKPAKAIETIVAERGGVDGLVDFDFTRLTVARLDGEERKCLTEAMYFEARSEPRVGQLAVADVVLNRVASPVYPNSICEVVYQGAERRTGCQFSFTCDGSLKGRVSKRKWKEIDDLSVAVLSGVRAPVSRNATHYHATYVSPPWAETLTPTATVGSHKFYRFPSRSVVAAAPAEM